MKTDNKHTRRNFIKTTAAFAGGAVILGSGQSFASSPMNNTELDISIFSKHLQFLNYKNMAEAAKEIGFKGVDLTVRPKGHVLPERVVEDLPKAAKALNEYDLTPNMFTSNVSDAGNPLHQDVLKAAAKEGFKCYRTNWLKYKNLNSIEKDLEIYNAQLKSLATLNQQLNLCGAYQNHAGNSVGSPVWDIKQLLDGIAPQNLGAQYDIRHATVEGANSWELGFHLIKDHINSLVIKDFKWGMIDGKWKVINVPLGQGMVDFNRFFKLLKQHNIHVPVSLHLEYDLGGAEKGMSKLNITQKEVFRYMKQDLLYLKKLWNEA